MPEKKNLEEKEEDEIKWCKDELKVLGKDERKKIKNLYKEKIGMMTLRKSGYKNRPVSFYCQYPDYLVEKYQAINKQVKKLSRQESKENLLESDTNRVGVVLQFPNPSVLIKLTPATFLSKYSVPLAKVGNVYKTIKQIMKYNGFIMTQSRRYTFCWGFSKHRNQVHVATHLTRNCSRTSASRTSRAAGRWAARTSSG